MAGSTCAEGFPGTEMCLEGASMACFIHQHQVLPGGASLPDLFHDERPQGASRATESAPHFSEKGRGSGLRSEGIRATGS